MSVFLSIGDAAASTGVNVETIRYYEKIGLLPKPPRTASNYRTYGQDQVLRLGFIRRSRELGFPIEQVRELLDLAAHHEHDCCRVDELTEEHLVGIDRKIQDLLALRKELAALLDSCQGGMVRECRILEAIVPGSVAEKC